MDFRQLQYMIKVAEEKNFSKAAQKLFIAQPSLSQYIQKIESQLGIQLFDRSSTPLKLTYAGELYIESAKRILDLKDQLYQQIEDISNLRKGRLTIGLSPFRSTYIMPKILPYFHDKFPGIEIVLIEGTSNELEDLALKGTTDITITTLPVNEELFSYESILTEEILIAIPPNHPLAKKSKDKSVHSSPFQKISFSELKDESFILLKQDQKLHQIAIDLCNQAGFKPKTVLESKSTEAAHALTLAGMGITIIPDTLAHFFRSSEHPVYFSIADLSSTREVVVAYRKDRYLSAAAKEFIINTKDVFASVKNHE